MVDAKLRIETEHFRSWRSLWFKRAKSVTATHEPTGIKATVLVHKPS